MGVGAWYVDGVFRADVVEQAGKKLKYVTIKGRETLTRKQHTQKPEAVTFANQVQPTARTVWMIQNLGLPDQLLTPGGRGGTQTSSPIPSCPSKCLQGPYGDFHSHWASKGIADGQQGSWDDERGQMGTKCHSAASGDSWDG